MSPLEPMTIVLRAVWARSSSKFIRFSTLLLVTEGSIERKKASKKKNQRKKAEKVRE